MLVLFIYCLFTFLFFFYQYVCFLYKVRFYIRACWKSYDCSPMLMFFLHFKVLLYHFVNCKVNIPLNAFFFLLYYNLFLQKHYNPVNLLLQVTSTIELSLKPSHSLRIWSNWDKGYGNRSLMATVYLIKPRAQFHNGWFDLSRASEGQHWLS